jgi:hypothetical protein
MNLLLIHVFSQIFLRSPSMFICPTISEKYSQRPFFYLIQKSQNSLKFYWMQIVYIFFSRAFAETFVASIYAETHRYLRINWPVTFIQNSPNLDRLNKTQ